MAHRPQLVVGSSVCSSSPARVTALRLGPAVGRTRPAALAAAVCRPARTAAEIYASMHHAHHRRDPRSSPGRARRGGAAAAGRGGTLLVAARPTWRRELGVWVLLLAFVGVARCRSPRRPASSSSTPSGEPAHQDPRAPGGHPARPRADLPGAARGDGVRRPPARRRGPGRLPGAAHAIATDTATLQRVTTIVGVLAALAGLVVMGLVAWIGHAGATAVWSGVTGG